MTSTLQQAAGVMIAIAVLALGACTSRTIGGSTVYVGPAVVFATIDLSCGDKTYTVSTGNNKGECKSSGQNAVCGDSTGNSTEVSCASGCINSNGSASCSIKSQ